MKVLIAPDSFKDSLSAKEVGEAIRRGLLKLSGNWNIRIIPMADGGEGTVEALVDATGGKILTAIVNDPLLRPVEAKYGILGDGKTAVVEMAAASGIELLKPEERNPWNTSTAGTGELIIKALEQGCRRIIVGIGGSATNDAGVGMAKALGAKFLDKQGLQIPEGGGGLGLIDRIDINSIDKRIYDTEIIVACDVSNPLTGQNGASQIFGFQKGADAKMVKELDKNLKHFSAIVKKQLEKDVEHQQGAGAAGGLGAGFLVFTNAILKTGFDIICHETKLRDFITDADLVITGEGKIDSQTKYGKTPMGVMKEAKKFGKPVIAIAGSLGKGYNELYNLGFDAIFSIMDKPMTVKEALNNAPQLIERCVADAMRLFLLGKAYKKIHDNS